MDDDPDLILSNKTIRYCSINTPPDENFNLFLLHTRYRMKLIQLEKDNFQCELHI
jgi:hypothetical protein